MVSGAVYVCANSIRKCVCIWFCWPLQILGICECPLNLGFAATSTGDRHYMCRHYTYVCVRFVTVLIRACLGIPGIFTDEMQFSCVWIDSASGSGLVLFGLQGITDSVNLQIFF